MCCRWGAPVLQQQQLLPRASPVRDFMRREGRAPAAASVAAGRQHRGRAATEVRLWRAQEGGFSDISFTMAEGVPRDFHDNDCVLVSAIHPDVSGPRGQHRVESGGGPAEGLPDCCCWA